MPLGASPPYLCLLRRNFCVTGECFFSYSGAIFERPIPFLLTTAAQNMHDLRRKLLLLGNHFFGWLKTENFSTACGTVTLKSAPSRGADAPHIHQRLRKRPPRCTLDCGFKTSESPALRGFVAERCPTTGTSLYLVLKSNGLRHPKNLPVKFGFSSKTVPANIAKKLPPQHCSKPLFIAFFNFSHKRPTLAFSGENGYTLAFANRIAHSGSHAETGGPSLPRPQCGLVPPAKSLLFCHAFIYIHFPVLCEPSLSAEGEKSGKAAATALSQTVFQFLS